MASGEITVRGGPKDFLPIAAVVAVGILIACSAFLLVRGYYHDHDRNQFQRDAGDFGASFEGLLGRHVTSLEAIRAFVSASHAVSCWEFSKFAHQILPQNSGFRGVLWLPSLPDGKRAAFEASMQRDGLYGLKLRELISNGELVDATKQSEYLPVAFVEPFELSGNLIGVNLSNNPIYAPLFSAATRRGKVSASDPLDHALLDGVAGPLLLLAFPLDQPTETKATVSSEMLQGYALGVLQLNRIIDSAMGAHVPVQAAIAYRVSGILKVFGSTTAGGTIDLEKWYGASEFHALKSFAVGGREFFLAIRSSSNADILTRLYVPSGSALLVLALTLLLAQSMLTTILRKRLVERAVIEATAEMRLFNEALEAEVAQRRQAEAESRIARDRAESANRAKSAFLSTMSHELRTPLNSIIGFSEMLLKLSEISQENEQDYLVEIHGSGARLLDLINDILDITQMDTETRGSDDLIYLADVIGAVIEKLTPEAEAKSISLTGSAPHTLPALRGDGKRIQKALHHLVTNAIKFTEPGGRAEVSVKSEAGGLLLEVTDTGIGMPPGMEALIVQLFDQGDQTLARRHEGIGLGLTFVRRVAALHEATLRMLSKEGEGTRVGLFFPSRRLIPTTEVA